MTLEDIMRIKSKIYVYYIRPLDSLGIYLADSKEEALKSITSEIWDNVDWDKLQNPSADDREAAVKEYLGEGLSDAQISNLMEPERPINIYNAIELWTWEEYQEKQGFAVSDRLLEITS